MGIDSEGETAGHTLHQRALDAEVEADYEIGRGNTEEADHSSGSPLDCYREGIERWVDGTKRRIELGTLG